VSVEPISSATPAGDAFLGRYQAALGEFKQSRYAKAMDMFEALITSSEPNDMTDNCAYWIGECLMALKRPTEAIDWFNRIMISRGSDKIDDALMMRAQALLRIGDTQGARKDYQRVVSEFPNSEYAARARQQLKALKRR
jgi:TolA-binding protein